MPNYLKMEKKETVRALLRLGWSYRRIERETGVRRETISKYAEKEGRKAAKVPAGEAENRPECPPGTASRCEEYRDLIESKLRQGLTAKRIYQDLVFEAGFEGSYDSVKRFCRGLKERRREVFVRLGTAPGEEVQVDFGRGALTRLESGDRYRRPPLFKAVLSHSRHSYEEVVWRQDLRSFIGCLERAFEAFGGVPAVVRVDNLKAAVTRACLYDPDLNTVFAAVARHYGFAVLPIRPRRPQENGKVERSHAYTWSSALKGRRFESLEDQNRHLQWWNRQVARWRIHGTTKQQVWSRFEQEERPALQPLPPTRFRFFHSGTRVVSADGHVEVERAFYSVPAGYLGLELRVDWDDALVRVYHQDEQVALHCRQSPGRFQTDQEHLSEQRSWTQIRLEGRLLVKARRIGAEAGRWAEEALEQRGVLAYRLLQGMISLTRKYPAEVVETACETARRHGTFRYRTLVELCKRKPVPQGHLFTREHELIRPLSEYEALLREGGVQ